MSEKANEFPKGKPTKPVDVEVLNLIIETLKPFDPETQLRIIKTVIVFYGLNIEVELP